MFFSIISFLVRTITMAFISRCLLAHIFLIILIFLCRGWTYKLLRFWCSLYWSWRSWRVSWDLWRRCSSNRSCTVRDAWLLAHSSLWLRVRITTTRHPELTPPLRRGSSSVKKTTHRSSTSILWYRLLTPPLPMLLHPILPILAKIDPTPIPTCSSILLVICSIRRDWSCDRNDRLSRMF